MLEIFDISPHFLLAVLLAAIINVIVGTIWYAPMVFGKMWQKEVGLKKSQMNTRNMMTATIASFICYLIFAYIFFLLPGIFAGTLNTTIMYIVILWIAFVVSIRLSHYAYEQRTPTFFLITIFHDLVSLLAMGIFYWYWK
jgi:hypothetical protein